MWMQPAYPNMPSAMGVPLAAGGYPTVPGHPAAMPGIGIQIRMITGGCVLMCLNAIVCFNHDHFNFQFTFYFHHNDQYNHKIWT